MRVSELRNQVGWGGGGESKDGLVVGETKTSWKEACPVALGMTGLCGPLAGKEHSNDQCWDDKAGQSLCTRALRLQGKGLSSEDTG